MRDLFHDLRSTLSRHHAEFQRAASFRTVLAGHGDPQAVLAAMKRGSTLCDAERDAIVRALVLERAANAHPLWSTMLILVFAPALLRLRQRVGHGRVEDLEPMLVQSLLEAVDGVSARSAAVVLAVQRATARKLFQKLRARRPGAEQPFDPRTPEVPWHREPTAFVVCAAREVLRACARVPGATEAAMACAGMAEQGDEAGDAREATRATAAERRLARKRVQQRHARVLSRVREELVSHARWRHVPSA
jgi:hypothetical protein